jgi:hypothetical protein
VTCHDNEELTLQIGQLGNSPMQNGSPSVSRSQATTPKIAYRISDRVTSSSRLVSKFICNSCATYEYARLFKASKYLMDGEFFFLSKNSPYANGFIFGSLKKLYKYCTRIHTAQVSFVTPTTGISSSAMPPGTPASSHGIIHP